jgi:hypothetical protein
MTHGPPLPVPSPTPPHQPPFCFAFQDPKYTHCIVPAPLSSFVVSALP